MNDVYDVERHELHDVVMSYINVDRKNPPPQGGFPIYYVPWSRTGRKRTPPEEPPPKLINFVGGFSGEVLFLLVLDLGTYQIGNPPGGGGSFDRRDELDESGELQQIAERVAQNLENIYKQIQQTRILPNGIYD